MSEIQEAARREVLLVEYQKAQDSAEHHDNLVGSVTSLWLGSAILVGFVLTGLDSHRLGNGIKIALYLVIALGIVLTFAVYSWALRASHIKNQKYARCKEIETILGMEQHTNVSRARRWQNPLYAVLMGLLLATWGVLLLDVAHR